MRRFKGEMRMKRATIIAAVITFVFFGCSEQSNPVGPALTSGVVTSSTISGVKKEDRVQPGLIGIQPVLMGFEPALTDGAADTNIITVSQPIIANLGGSVRLRGAFPDKHGDSVSYDLSIMFPAGALPYDATISISFDKRTFADNGLVTFWPHGIVFHTPGTLSLSATNIDFVKKNDVVNFYYDANGVMQLMPDSWGSVTKKRGSTSVSAGAAIPHFSAYAFGR